MSLPREGSHRTHERTTAVAKYSIVECSRIFGCNKAEIFASETISTVALLAMPLKSELRSEVR